MSALWEDKKLKTSKTVKIKAKKDADESKSRHNKHGVDCSVVCNNDSKPDTSKRKIGAKEEAISAKRRGTQNTGKKSTVSGKTIKDDKCADTDRKRRCTKNKESVSSKDTSVIESGKRSKGVDAENRKIGKRKTTPNGNDGKDGNGTGKIETSKSGYKHETGRGKKEKEVKGNFDLSPVENYSDYPVSEFEKSDKTMYSVVCVPTKRTFKDSTLMEILFNGKRYVVSKWSVKNNIYTQGLDSNFLVNKLITSKKANK